MYTVYVYGWEYTTHAKPQNEYWEKKQDSYGPLIGVGICPLYSASALKGVWHEIFDIRFFS